MELISRCIVSNYFSICIVSAIEWVIDNKEKYNTKILNLSLGTPANNPIKSDPLVKAVDEAIRAGITVVVAAGNSGPNAQTILSPGNSPSVITVGAVDDRKAKTENAYSIAPFSSRGPTKEGLRKPDVVAPGVNIKSLSNSDGYKSLSGTSMATPVVAGSLALMLSKDGSLQPKELKSEIMKSCTSLNENPDNQGAGVININRLFNKGKKDKNSKKTKPARSTRPGRSRVQKPFREKPSPKPESIPVVPNEGNDVDKQDYMANSLIFLLFLILILIRVV